MKREDALSRSKRLVIKVVANGYQDIDLKVLLEM